MNRLLFFIGFCLLMCSFGCSPKATVPMVHKPTSAAPSVEEGLLFKRSNLIVSDLDQSMTIYRDILGFIPGEVSVSGADSYSYPVFKIPRSANIRFVALDTPSQVRTMALTEVTGYELPKPSIPLMSALVLRVDDIVATMDKIIALDLEVTKLKSVKSPRLDFKEQAFVDFDGHLIVLYQTR